MFLGLDRSSDAGAVRTRTLGILGGMGPLATAHFYTRFVQSSTARLDQDHHRVVMVSDPKIPDRTAFILGQGPDPRPRLARAAKQLAQMGAELIVVPCNSASPFARDIEEAAGIPVVDWIGIAANHIRDLGQQPVGIVATRGTLSAQVYQHALSERNVTFVTPLPDVVDLTMTSIYGPHGVKTVNSATPKAINDLRSVVETLVDMGARSVILACTELPILADGMSDRLVPLIDPGELTIAWVHQVFSEPVSESLIG